MRRVRKRNRLFAGWFSIFKKEWIHMIYSPLVITLAVFTPFCELVLVGLAINLDVSQIETVVYDLANTQESNKLIEQFSNTDDFRISKRVHSDKDLYKTIVSGQAHVGIKIPYDYSKQIAEGKSASVLVIVDGSNATLSTEAINVSNRIALDESISQLRSKFGVSDLPVEVRPSVLFNPAAQTSYFLIPGLIDFALPLTVVTLLSFSIVGEREKGTLEQLYMTPVSPLGVMVGKMLPYGMIGLFDLSGFLLGMRYLFDVPIKGSILLIIIMSIPFLMAILGLALIISTQARTQVEALQMVIVFRFLPGVYLSTYLFPLENLGRPFQIISRMLPDPYYVEVLRGVIVRGAGIEDVWLNGLVMLAMGIVMLSVATWLFQRTTS